MLPDLDAARPPRLWVLSDTFAQPGLLLFRHLLRRTKRDIALVCLETDPDKLLEGSEANKVDCYDGWSTCEEFDLVAPLRSSPRKYVQLSSARKLPVELLAGLKGHPVRRPLPAERKLTSRRPTSLLIPPLPSSRRSHYRQPSRFSATSSIPSLVRVSASCSAIC